MGIYNDKAVLRHTSTIGATAVDLINFGLSSGTVGACHSVIITPHDGSLMYSVDPVAAAYTSGHYIPEDATVQVQGTDHVRKMTLVNAATSGAVKTTITLVKKG